MTRCGGARLVALVLANALLPVAVLVFALGFFPFKPLLPGLAAFEDGKGTGEWIGKRPEAVFDRVVFMVVDALRSDFVYGHNSGFQFTQSLIRDGAAIPFTAHAAPPTVTMPRVKAITTGSVPSFADLIFNIDETGSGATLAAQDTWLAQIRARGGKLVFYGDDTWLRLFPDGFFARSDGTSSFFVSDFTEVDHNVTRHLPEELNRDDWDAMIMHYLGLDHIGHKTGPRGPNMLPKQKEMDDTVRQIYGTMETTGHHANTLLVVLGDHGMNAGGNHGGSGPGETEPALLFASPKLKQRHARPHYESPAHPQRGTEYHYYRKVEQSDIVPTLASLMGMPIPKNSLGVFIDEFAACWRHTEDNLRLLYENSRQMKSIVEAAFGLESFTSLISIHVDRLRTSASDPCSSTEQDGVADALACRWAFITYHLFEAAGPKEDRLHAAHASLVEFLSLAQDTLRSVASSYDIPKMVAGMGISFVSLVLAGVSLPRLWPPSTAGVFFAFTCTLYGVMMFASSYVEEEQHFWYWLTPAWIVILTANALTHTGDLRRKMDLASSCVTVLAVHRVAVRWNQTGQKHAGEPDIVHAFFSKEFVLMWILILATYGYVCAMLVRRTLLDLMPPEVSVAIATIIVIPAVVFKLNFTQADAPELVRGLAYKIREWTEPFTLVSQAQLTFTLLALAAIVVTAMAVGLARGTVIAKASGPPVHVTLAERLHYLFTLFLITQTRAPNIPLFLGLIYQQRALQILLSASRLSNNSKQLKKDAIVSAVQLATSILLLSHTYFFCIGGSNSISSIDLSQAYNGVGDYNITAVGVLLFASNWTGPTWWCSAAVLLTIAKPHDDSVLKEARSYGGCTWIDEEREKLRMDAIATPSDQSKRSSHHERNRDLWLLYISALTVFVAAGLLAVMASCTILRTHLFIWTVFSPKYLYAMAWCIGWHLVLNIGLGCLLRYAGKIA